jgi:positive regulator of sigma E activity
MTHLLYLHLVMDIFLAVMMAFVYSDNEPKAVWAIAVFAVLAILSFLAIRYIKQHELKNQLAEA